MTALSDLNSWKSVPTRFIAITDGASSGLIDTDRIWPTTWSCGTVMFRMATTAIQPRMIGTANRRIHFARPVWLACPVASSDSVVGTTLGSGTSAELLPGSLNPAQLLVGLHSYQSLPRVRPVTCSVSADP